jgi:hypothetical protein
MPFGRRLRLIMRLFSLHTRQKIRLFVRAGFFFDVLVIPRLADGQRMAQRLYGPFAFIIGDVPDPFPLGYLFRRFTKKLSASCNISISSFFSRSSFRSFSFSATNPSGPFSAPISLTLACLFCSLDDPV